jgi:hypothetical protein
VGCCPTTREISSGSSASPANRNVANTWLVLSEFVVDVAEVFAMLIRNRPIIIYDHAIRSAKIARGLIEVRAIACSGLGAQGRDISNA